MHFPIQRVAAGAFDLHNGSGLNADGLLGADILLAYDMDIDVPAGMLTLYRSRLCPDMQPPWQEPWIEITGVRTRKDRLLVPFELDGAEGMALLDTGAQGNVLGVAMARRMGLSEQELAADPAVRNAGTGGVILSRRHIFNRLRVGPVVEASPEMTVCHRISGLVMPCSGSSSCEAAASGCHSATGRYLFPGVRKNDLDPSRP